MDPRQFDTILKEARLSALLEKLYAALSGKPSIEKGEQAAVFVRTIIQNYPETASKLLSDKNKNFKGKSALLKAIAHQYGAVVTLIRASGITEQQCYLQDYHAMLQLISRLSAKDVADDRQLHEYAIYICRIVKSHRNDDQIYAALTAKWVGESSSPNPIHSQVIVQDHLLKAAQRLQSHLCFYYAVVLDTKMHKKPPYQDVIQHATSAKDLCVQSALSEVKKQAFCNSLERLLAKSIFQQVLAEIKNISDSAKQQAEQGSQSASAFRIFKRDVSPYDRVLARERSYENLEKEFLRACVVANLAVENHDWIAASLMAHENSEPEIAQMVLKLVGAIRPRPSTPTMMDS
jgi:hypothetical protein